VVAVVVTWRLWWSTVDDVVSLLSAELGVGEVEDNSDSPELDDSMMRAFGVLTFNKVGVVGGGDM
jgi:hypothetical protein